jgi:hypothetical protein
VSGTYLALAFVSAIAVWLVIRLSPKVLVSVQKRTFPYFLPRRVGFFYDFRFSKTHPLYIFIR